MRIGVIGAGHIGGTAAKLFAEAGHEVAVANSRGPSSLGGLVASHRPKARALPAGEAVKIDEDLLLAIPQTRKEELPAHETYEEKVMIDATNYHSVAGEILEP